MVYQIYFEKRKNCLYDIEIYKTINELSKSEDNKWYIELHCHAFITGATEFIRKKIDDSNIEEFYRDCENIEFLRGWLWEQHNNKCGNNNEVNARYAVIHKELKDIIYNFASKWGLYVNED